MPKPNSDVMESIVYSLAEAIDTPRSLAVWLCFKYNQEALVELPMPAIATNNTSEFQLDYFITEYLSKYKGLKLKAKPEVVALGRWRTTEVACAETNLRFRKFTFGRLPFDGHVEAALFGAQRKIGELLGPLKVGKALSGCKWGPGATFDMRREVATPDKKISTAISVTSAAAPYLRAVVESDPHWASCFLGVIPEAAFSLLPSTYKIVRGSRFLTVPKNAKTDRVIAAEPTGNGFLQQGVHSYMRKRLKHFGVNLDDQSINRMRARRAYSEGLSTLDLSAASDTISRELVYHLLPLDWACFLDTLRSPETRVGSEWIRTEKFASMGNAFCFELETLIFWAIASSVAEISGRVNSVSVYGDDLIIDRRDYDRTTEMLAFCGFTVNEKKSYRTGNFFESCGGHFHRGKEVTPVYQKEKLLHPSELIRAHNRLVRLASRVPSDIGARIIRGPARVITKLYPLRPFPRIPFGAVEDGGFLRPLSEFSLDKNHGFRCHVLDYVPKHISAREDAMYAYKLRRPFSLNPDVRGYSVNVAKGSWRTKVRWVPEHSTLNSVDNSSYPGT